MSRILFIFILFVSSVGFSQNDSLFRIADIRVEGNSRTNEDAIIIRSRLKIDTWITIPGAQTIHAMKALWETGDFKSVQIVENHLSNGIELIIKVEEYYSLGNITYNGLVSSEIRKMNENPYVRKKARTQAILVRA